jgi:hypothetical protein
VNTSDSKPPPTNWDARDVLGERGPDGDADRTIGEDGRQKGYVVLSAEERARGFVRPVRRTYLHEKCGTTTTMGSALAETYAREPAFYCGTFCCACGAHFPVGESGEFVWAGTTEKVGT